MGKVKILDCTLRDGGYLNNWSFGYSNIIKIVEYLNFAGIDYIECGFLSEQSFFDKDRSVYPSLSVFFDIFGDDNKYALMVNYGEYDLYKLPESNIDIELRIAFKPYQLSRIKDYVHPLVSRSIKFSLNPMHISLYNEEDLSHLMKIANEIMPVSFTAVDTMGIMNPYEVSSLFGVLDKKLDNKISLGFHSHNNLSFSFDNIMALLSLQTDRNIVVDTTLSGVARGGGMLATEDIAIYLNDTFNCRYNVVSVNEAKAFLNILELYDKTPYVLSAELKCHPNYAKFLVDNNCPQVFMKDVLSLIPDKNKPYYAKEIIEKLFNDKKNSLISEEV